MKTLLLVVAALAIPMSAQAGTKHHRVPHQALGYQPQIACTDVRVLAGSPRLLPGRWKNVRRVADRI